MPPVPQASSILALLGQAAFVWDLIADTIAWSDNAGAVFTDIPPAALASGSAFARLIRDRDRSFDFDVPAGASSSLAADLCAQHLVMDPKERQELLETLDVATRVRRVTEILALQRHALSAVGHNLN